MRSGAAPRDRVLSAAETRGWWAAGRQSEVWVCVSGLLQLSARTLRAALLFPEMQPKVQSPHLEALRSLDFTLQLKALFATHRSIIAYSCLLFRVMKWLLPPVSLSIIPLSPLLLVRLFHNSLFSERSCGTVRIQWR